jgi:predicted nucleic acid-binding protein
MLIDSSAIVKFITKEPGWESVELYIDQATTIPLALVELGSAFLRKKRKNELPEELGAEILKVYGKTAVFIDQNKYLEAAFEIAFESNVTMYDGLFIAAARGEGGGLVSCDDRQLKVAESLGVRTIRC